MLIRKEEKVALANPGDATAELLVAAAPTSFIGAIRHWPDVDPT